VPAPRPRQTVPDISRGAPDARFDERGLVPPGGIDHSRWNVIVVHHSANTSDTPQSMDNYHRRVRKWANGLGYHFVVGNGVKTVDGKVYVGPRWKRQITGAHCKSSSGRYFGIWRKSNYFNSHGIGICLIGDFEQRSPTPKQLESLARLTRFLCSRARINPAHIYGHGDITHKTLCPGRYLKRKLAQVRAQVARSLAVTLDPGLPAGWPSGLNQQFAAGSNTYLERTFLAAHAGLKTGNALYGGLCHALDHVADLQGGALGRTVLGDVDHHHAD
jgi:hypothetical protein